MTAPVNGPNRICGDHNTVDCQWCFPLYHKRVKDDTCGTCVFFEEGKCHRNPPVIVAGFDEVGPLGVSFPSVNEGWWCGEYKREVPRNAQGSWVW